VSSLRFEAFLARLYSDHRFLERFLSDPGAAMSAANLDAREQKAAAQIDRAGLLMAARSYESKRRRRRVGSRGGFVLNYRMVAGRIFFGEDGRLRPLWRAVIFYFLGAWIVAPMLDRVFQLVAGALNLGQELSAATVALGELEIFIGTLICTGIFALYERRRVDSYGLPIRLALKARTWEGALAGLIAAGAVGVGMYALGGMQIRGLAVTGNALTISALAWLAANICVGLAEEFWYRSYLLQTLWKSLGFWPAAAIIALIFAADHYFTKPGENIWDVVTLVSLSLLMSYTVLRTGTLWFAVGFHVAFDYAQLFIIGTPNGSQIPVGRLLDVRFDGPAWLTGGALGTEASVLMYPTIALLCLYVWWRFRPQGGQS
jgi:membrane protease YdiL (CAAX protease family)